MRAIVCEQFGAPDTVRLQDLPSPDPGPGEVLVEVHAIGVNFTDLLAISGRSQLKRQLPMTPGVEAAGVIIALGAGVQRLHIGQRVLGACISGAYAEQVVFAEDELFPIPDAMDMRSAATFYIASMTSYYALSDRARLSAGELLLVLGAGGGAGLAAVQIGKALGATVVAAASSPEKLALAAAAGADATLLYPREPLDLAAQKHFSGELLTLAKHSNETPNTVGKISSVHRSAGYHVVHDGVGGSYTEPALRALAWEGRYASLGFAAGVPRIGLGSLLFKNAELLGIQPSDDAFRLPGRRPEVTRRLIDWFLAGALRPNITAEFPLQHTAGALTMLAERRAHGRIVLLTR